MPIHEPIRVRSGCARCAEGRPAWRSTSDGVTWWSHLIPNGDGLSSEPCDAGHIREEAYVKGVVDATSEPRAEFFEAWAGLKEALWRAFYMDRLEAAVRSFSGWWRGSR